MPLPYGGVLMGACVNHLLLFLLTIFLMISIISTVGEVQNPTFQGSNYVELYNEGWLIYTWHACATERGLP